MSGNESDFIIQNTEFNLHCQNFVINGQICLIFGQNLLSYDRPNMLNTSNMTLTCERPSPSGNKNEHCPHLCWILLDKLFI